MPRYHYRLGFLIESSNIYFRYMLQKNNLEGSYAHHQTDHQCCTARKTIWKRKHLNLIERLLLRRYHTATFLGHRYHSYCVNSIISKLKLSAGESNSGWGLFSCPSCKEHVKTRFYFLVQGTGLISEKFSPREKVFSIS